MWAKRIRGLHPTAVTGGGAVRLESRTGKDLTGTYPEVRDALAAQRSEKLLVDGEVVAFDGDQTSFGRLQQRLGVASPAPSLLEVLPDSSCPAR